MLYAIKSDTLFFNRQTNRVDLEAFSYLYPLADAALIRKMEGAEITLERLDYVIKAYAARAAGRAGVLRVPRRAAARGLHPLRRRLLPAARGRASGRSSPASSTTRWSCRCATSATRRTPASSCGGSSPTSAAPAATARWPRRWCRCARSARSSATSQASDIDAAAAGARARVPARDAGARRTRSREVRSRLRIKNSNVRSRATGRLSTRHVRIPILSSRAPDRDRRSDPAASSSPTDSRIMPLRHARLRAAARRCAPTATSAPAG